MINYRLKCEPLTPIHIGSGEEIDAYEYVVAGGKLHKLNLENFLSALSLSEQEQALKFIETDVFAFRDFASGVFEKLDGDKVVDFSTPITKKFLEIYNSKIDDTENKLAVRLFSRSLDKPFFPGSSLKGAIRTAVLGELYPARKDEIAKLERWEIKKKFEQAILNCSGPQSDPFKAVKTSDSLTLFQTLVVNSRVSTFRRGNWECDKYNIFLEVVNIGSIFEMELRIDEKLQIQNKKRNSGFIPIGLDLISKSCRDFYSAHLDNEMRRLRDSRARSQIETLKVKFSEIKKCSDFSFPLRVGWGSGFDAVTLKGSDDFIKYINPKLKEIKSAKLVQDAIPMGWLKVIPSEMNNN